MTHRKRILALALVSAALSSGLCAQTSAKKPQIRPHAVAEAPLSAREKAAQLLNRFTFGPRPGDLDAVLKMGPEAWFEQQLDPNSIPDPVVDKRLQDYPALRLTSSQIVYNFPTNQVLREISQGKQSSPQDAILAGVYGVLETKYTRDQEAKKAEQTIKLTPEQVDQQKAALKKQNQAIALAFSEQLLGMPKAQRMGAILGSSVDQRIALAESTPDPQKKMLLADFNPREREIFYAMGGRPGRSACRRKRIATGQSPARHLERAAASGSDDRLLVQPLQRLPQQRYRPNLHSSVRAGRHSRPCARQVSRPLAREPRSIRRCWFISITG